MHTRPLQSKLQHKNNLVDLLLEAVQRKVHVRWLANSSSALHPSTAAAAAAAAATDRTRCACRLTESLEFTLCCMIKWSVRTKQLAVPALHLPGGKDRPGLSGGELGLPDHTHPAQATLSPALLLLEARTATRPREQVWPAALRCPVAPRHPASSPLTLLGRNRRPARLQRCLSDRRAPACPCLQPPLNAGPSSPLHVQRPEQRRLCLFQRRLGRRGVSVTASSGTSSGRSGGGSSRGAPRLRPAAGRAPACSS